jgi:dienelactone hydrolase
MKLSKIVLIPLLFIGAWSHGQNQSIDPMWLSTPVASTNEFVVSVEEVLGSEIPTEIHMVEMLDGVYSPMSIRYPEGEGPFPTIVFAHMNGGFGLRWIRDWNNYGSGTLERFLDEGYAVVWMRYRAEVDTRFDTPFTEREFQGRQRFSRGPLEYQDAISIVEYVKGLTQVDSNRIGWFSVSHGSEMLFKVASEYQGIKAAIATEPANSDFIARLPNPPGDNNEGPDVETMDMNTPEMQAASVIDLRRRIHTALVQSRMSKITTPIFIVGRDRDHNQATFRLSYELMQELGKNVQWRSYDHGFHGFAFLERDASGVYDAGPIQQVFLEDAVSYFEQNLK